MRAPSTPSSTGFGYLDAGGALPRRPLAFAHRGGAGHPDLIGIENTLEAFEHAHRLGYAYLETDVHVTGDGHLIAFHDADVARLTGENDLIADLTLQQVKALRLDGRGEIPTLGELVDRLPAARLNIDLKCDRSPEALAGFIAERDLADRVLVGSFEADRLRRFRRITQGRIPTSAHRGEVAAFLLLPARLAEKVTRGRVAALQVPVRHRGIPIVNAAFVRRAHRVGKHVHVWTIDDPDEMRRLLDLGVDGLMTDRTDTLREVFTERGLWPQSQHRRHDDEHR